MNILSVIIILHAACIAFSMDINYNRCRLKNYTLRILVLKKKNAPKILNAIKRFYNKCYDKSVVSIAEGMNDYNSNFTEEEKIIIETILSLCY
jgi:flagellar motor component MotA